MLDEDAGSKRLTLRDCVHNVPVKYGIAGIKCDRRPCNHLDREESTHACLGDVYNGAV